MSEQPSSAPFSLLKNPKNLLALGIVIAGICSVFIFPSKTLAANCNLPANSGNTIVDIVPSGAKLYAIASNQLTSINTASNYVSNFTELPTTATFIEKVGNKLYVGTQGANVSVVNVTNDSIIASIPAGNSQVDSVVFGHKLYVSSNGAGNVTVINTLNDTVMATIALGASAERMILVGTKLYVIDGTDNVVYAINTLTNALIATIPVGTQPYSIHAIGNKVYATNLTSDDVSVIDANTDMVVATIPVGDGPQNAAVVGTKLYVNNSGDGDVSVIDSATDTVIGTHAVGTGPKDSAVVGTDIYINNGADDAVYVYDTLTDTVTTTINTGIGGGGTFIGGKNGSRIYLGATSGDVSVIETNTNTVISGCPQTFATNDMPFSSAAKGSKVYVNTLGSDMTVFDSSTDMISSTIIVGSGSYGGVMYQNKYFVFDYATGEVVVIDTLTDTVATTISTSGAGIHYGGIAGNKLYVANDLDNTVTIINADTNALVTILSMGGGTTPLRVYGTATKAYVLNSGTNTVSVIGVVSNTVSSTITVNANPDYGFFVGTDLYVVSSAAGNVKVIDTATDTVLRTITLGDTPNGGAVSGSKIFIANQNDANVNVINDGSSAVAATIAAGGAAVFPTIAGGRLFVSNYGDETVTVIDPATNKVTSLLPVGTNPFTSTVIGNKIFINNSGSNSVSIIDTDDFNFGDLQAPTLNEVAPIAALVADATPSYTFTSDEGGTIEYGGSCDSGNTSAGAGSNTITFDTLSDGTYEDCTITTIDSFSNRSASLLLAPFTIDTSGIPAPAPTPDPVSTGGQQTGGGGVSTERIIDGRVVHIAAVTAPTGTGIVTTSGPAPITGGSGNTSFLKDLSVSQSHMDVKRLQDISQCDRHNRGEIRSWIAGQGDEFLWSSNQAGRRSIPKEIRHQACKRILWPTYASFYQ